MVNTGYVECSDLSVRVTDVFVEASLGVKCSIWDEVRTQGSL